MACHARRTGPLLGRIDAPNTHVLQKVRIWQKTNFGPKASKAKIGRICIICASPFGILHLQAEARRVWQLARSAPKTEHGNRERSDKTLEALEKLKRSEKNCIAASSLSLDCRRLLCLLVPYVFRQVFMV